MATSGDQELFTVVLQQQDAHFHALEVVGDKVLMGGPEKLETSKTVVS